MFKKSMALILALLLAFGAVSSLALTKQEILQTAQENINAAKNFEAVQTQNMTMTVDGEKSKLNTVTTIKYQADPLLIYTSSVTTIGKTKEKVETYTQIVDDELVIYTVAGKSVTKDTVSLTDELLAELKGQAVPEYLQGYKSIDYVGTKSISKQKNYQFDVVMDAAYVQSTATDVLDMMNDSELANMFKNIPDIKCDIYVNTKTLQFTQIDFDMTELMTALFSGLGLEELGISVDKITTSTTFKNIGKLKSLSVPKSVLKKAQ